MTVYDFNLMSYPYCNLFFFPFFSGKKYAQIVIRMFVVWLLRNYKFTTNLKFDELTFKWMIVMKLGTGYPVKIEKR